MSITNSDCEMLPSHRQNLLAMALEIDNFEKINEDELPEEPFTPCAKWPMISYEMLGAGIFLSPEKLGIFEELTDDVPFGFPTIEDFHPRYVEDYGMLAGSRFSLLAEEIFNLRRGFRIYMGNYVRLALAGAATPSSPFRLSYLDDERLTAKVMVLTLGWYNDAFLPLGDLARLCVTKNSFLRQSLLNKRASLIELSMTDDGVVDDPWVLKDLDRIYLRVFKELFALVQGLQLCISLSTVEFFLNEIDVKEFSFERPDDADCALSVLDGLGGVVAFNDVSAQSVRRGNPVKLASLNSSRSSFYLSCSGAMIVTSDSQHYAFGVRFKGVEGAAYLKARFEDSGDGCLYHHEGGGHFGLKRSKGLAFSKGSDALFVTHIQYVNAVANLLKAFSLSFRSCAFVDANWLGSRVIRVSTEPIPNSKLRLVPPAEYPQEWIAGLLNDVYRSIQTNYRQLSYFSSPVVRKVETALLPLQTTLTFGTPCSHCGYNYGDVSRDQSEFGFVRSLYFDILTSRLGTTIIGVTLCLYLSRLTVRSRWSDSVSHEVLSDKAFLSDVKCHCPIFFIKTRLFKRAFNDCFHMSAARASFEYNFFLSHMITDMRCSMDKRLHRYFSLFPKYVSTNIEDLTRPLWDSELNQPAYPLNLLICDLREPLLRGIAKGILRKKAQPPILSYMLRFR